MKQYSTRDFKRILQDNGYEYVRTKGDHSTYRKENKVLTINVVRLKPIVANRLIKEYSLVVK